MLTYKESWSRLAIVVLVTVLCLNISMTDCFDKREEKFCTGKKAGMYKHTSYCDMYILCAQGITYEMSCPPSLYFNAMKNYCDFKANVECAGSTSSDGNSNSKSADPKPEEPISTYNGHGKVNKCKRIVCYFANWPQYRNQGKHIPKDIDVNLCTHITYAFLNLDRQLKLREWKDDSFLKQIVSKKKSRPGLKVLVATGGWVMGTAPFVAMVKTSQTRNFFITTTISFLRKYDLDGFDIDWEYPGARGSPPGDKYRFTSLISELRAAFEKEAKTSGKPRLLLTAAVAAGKSKIDGGYEVSKIDRHLDFISLMAYDLHGEWDGVTGHQSPLSGEFGDTLTTEYAAEYWIRKGATRSKLVIGLAMYGRTFTLKSMAENGVGAPSRGGGRSGRYTGEAGFLSYYEICEILKKPGVFKGHVNGDENPYLVDGNQWVGYDDPENARKKVRYARSGGYGGMMVWDLSLDDFKGTFCNQGRYPFLTAVNDECRE